MLLMGLWSSYIYEKDTVSLADCVNNPAKYDLQPVELYNDTVVAGKDTTGITINSRGIVFPVKFKDEINRILKGEYISLLAVFHKEGYLEAEKYHIHKHRRIKMATSNIAAFVFIVLFFFRFRFNPDKFIFEDK